MELVRRRNLCIGSSTEIWMIFIIMNEPHFQVSLTPADIRIEGLSIQQKEGLHLLTSEMPKIPGAGICAEPSLTVTGVPNGYLYYSQLCTHHLLRIKIDGQWKGFLTGGKIYGDCPSDGRSYLQRYLIENNEVLDYEKGQQTRPIVSDIPYFILCNTIEAMQYDLRLETWLQYGNHAGPTQPILKFSWSLNADISNTNTGWEMGWSKFSSPEDIARSIHRFDPETPPIKVRDYCDLKKAVQNFWDEVVAGSRK